MAVQRVLEVTDVKSRLSIFWKKFVFGQYSKITVFFRLDPILGSGSEPLVHCYILLDLLCETKTNITVVLLLNTINFSILFLEEIREL